MAQRRIALPESLSPASIEALSSTLEESALAGATAWVLCGSSKVFCRGMDLSAMSGSGADAAASLERFASCVSRLRHAPCPTIALVEGDALGGGVGLAAACDVVIASPQATFALPEALFGLLPGVILPVLLERMPAQKARLFALRGRAHDAEWARASGLVDELVPVEELDHAAARVTRELSRAAPSSVAGLRRWIFELTRLEDDAALIQGAGVTAARARDPEVQRVVRRFVEEGTPPWVDR